MGQWEKNFLWAFPFVAADNERMSTGKQMSGVFAQDLICFREKGGKVAVCQRF